jgi:hypothetical protein
LFTEFLKYIQYAIYLYEVRNMFDSGERFCEFRREGK